jgi:tRNA 2-thiouridine synthesizing protein D
MRSGSDPEEDVMTKKEITVVVMDAPYENERTVTALRLVDAAAQRGHAVTVFAYEGAVALTFQRQAKHPNAVHGCDTEQEDHPLPREWVSAILEQSRNHGGSVDWVNCGLCVDERGVGEAVAGVRRGGPADLWKAAAASDATLVIGTR